jgi:hypothetical protein
VFPVSWLAQPVELVVVAAAVEQPIGKVVSPSLFADTGLDSLWLEEHVLPARTLRQRISAVYQDRKSKTWFRFQATTDSLEQSNSLSLCPTPRLRAEVWYKLFRRSISRLLARLMVDIGIIWNA